MRQIARVYNQTRLAFLLCGIAFIVFGGYGFFYPDELEIGIRGYGHVAKDEKLEHFIIIFLIGTLMLTIRLVFMKYRRNEDFSQDIPLPSNVDFETTDDVNENIRRFKKAQLEAVKKLKK